MPRQKKADAFGIGTVFSFKFKSDRRFGLGPRKDAFIFVLNSYVFLPDGTSGSESSSPSGK